MSAEAARETILNLPGVVALFLSTKTRSHTQDCAAGILFQTVAVWLPKAASDGHRVRHSDQEREPETHVGN